MRGRAATDTGTRALAQGLLGLALCGLMHGCEPAQPVADDRADAPKLARGPDLFSTAHVRTLHLTLDPAAMAGLAKEPRAYVRGSLRYGSETLSDVAVRFKGHRTLRDWSGKPSLKLHFSHYKKGGRLLDRKSLILNNNVEDPTMLREALGYLAARELGVPAPRTGFAELFINGERFGLYTVVEPIDATLLSRHFRDPGGPLYEGEYGCDLYPDDVQSLELDDGDDPERTQIRALAAAASGPLDRLTHPEDGLIEQDSLLRFLSVMTLIGDFDGYRHVHNYRIYFDPGARRFSLMPWGLDRVLKQRIDPFDHHSLLALKCFGDRACRLAYVRSMHEVSQRFEALGLEAHLDTLDRVVRAAVKRDPRNPHSAAKRKSQVKKTRAFIRERAAELRARLSCWDGTRELDRDGDGHGCDDCDDTSAAVHPAAAEVCNGVDDNCNGLIDDDPRCPCPEVTLGERRFALCNLPMNHDAAGRFCRAQGAALARIEDREQSIALGRAAGALADTPFWIGLSDRAQEGSPVWSDGSAPSFTAWARGEPDHYACGQDCAALKPGGSGHWRDLHCARPRPFICSDFNALEAK